MEPFDFPTSDEIECRFVAGDAASLHFTQTPHGLSYDEPLRGP